MASFMNTMLASGLYLFIYASIVVHGRKSDDQSLIEDIADPKDLKKLLRTKNNVLVMFAKSDKDANRLMRIYTEAAVTLKGLGTLGYVNCGGEAKKMCKKMKINPEPVLLKHYKDGNFNKDYDRQETVQSLVNFMNDPLGDLPWEEDVSAVDVMHIADALGLQKILRKERNPLLIMFYAPWCNFCKRLKPEYAEAASQLKGKAVLAAIDVNRPENSIIRHHFNITGFPTLLYFENGNMKFPFGGETTKDGIVKWMENPVQAQQERPSESEWANTESDIVHLTDNSFEELVANKPAVLVMFYAPWCGHCKKMKPEYTEAAATVAKEGIDAVLAAVDATKEKELTVKFEIKGYPTVKYFQNGKFLYDIHERTADKILEFLKDPKEPPPLPPPEPAWSEIPSDVYHLDDATYKTLLKKKKHTLVMFYAPWCGHCKKAKPEFMDAASHFKDDPKVAFAAVDCTIHTTVCSSYEVQGYPTFKYFNYFNKQQINYSGGREKNDFIAFMTDPLNPASSIPPLPPRPEEHWADIVGNEDLHILDESNFDFILQQQESALVMFYAPWCGHCKAMKPSYVEAATKLKQQNISGILAAVDATIYRQLSLKYNIKGFPTLKYFRNGKYVADYDQKRTVDGFVNFMKNPPTGTKEKEEL